MSPEDRQIEDLATALAIGVAKVSSPRSMLVGLWAKLEEFDKDRFRKLAKDLIRSKAFVYG